MKSEEKESKRERGKTRRLAARIIPKREVAELVFNSSQLYTTPHPNLKMNTQELMQRLPEQLQTFRVRLSSRVLIKSSLQTPASFHRLPLRQPYEYTADEMFDI